VESGGRTPQLPFLAEFWSLIREDSFAKAEALARHVVSTNPEQYRGYYLVGVALHAQGKLVEAKRQARRAIKIWPSIENTPDYAAAYLLLGLIHQDEGRLAARRTCNDLLLLPPKWRVPMVSSQLCWPNRARLRKPSVFYKGQSA
jgi:tetratricopeptide (TPR) repeat protein